MNERRKNKLGVFMCKILRHEPQEYGAIIDEHGFCPVKDLLAAIRKSENWSDVTEEDLMEVVRTCSKQRYEVKGSRIRARYGHSVPIIQEPINRILPPFLYHGTNQQAYEHIQQDGLKPMGRQYVHLSEGIGFAQLAAKRRKGPMLLLVDTHLAKQMGTKFLYVGNEVWLSTEIAPECLCEYRK